MEEIKMMLFFLIMELFSYEWDTQKQKCPDPEKKYTMLILWLELNYE